MPDNDPLRKYIDAGMLFTQLTRQRAEEIVRELIRNGEFNRDQAARWVEELLDRSRQSTEQLLGVVRKELDDRIAQLNLVTRDDLANLASRLTGAAGRGGSAQPRSTAKAAGTARTGAAKKGKAPATKATKEPAGKAKPGGTTAKKAATATKATATKATSTKSGKATKAAKAAGDAPPARKA